MANGELLGVMLMMEDLVLGTKHQKSINWNEIIEKKPSSSSTQAQSNRNSKLSMTQSVNASNTNDEMIIEEDDDLNEQNVSKSIVRKNNKSSSSLIVNYKKWRFFLLTWKRLELLQLDWGRRKLGVENINTFELYSRFNENYRKEILLPVLKILVKGTDAQDIYDNVVDFKQPLLLPPDVSELESKMKQVKNCVFFFFVIFKPSSFEK
jgi:hypothetical protein